MIFGLAVVLLGGLSHSPGTVALGGLLALAGAASFIAAEVCGHLTYLAIGRAARSDPARAAGRTALVALCGTVGLLVAAYLGLMMYLEDTAGGRRGADAANAFAAFFAVQTVVSAGYLSLHLNAVGKCLDAVGGPDGGDD